MLTVADMGGGGGKICQNLADVICERSLNSKSLNSKSLNSKSLNSKSLNSRRNFPI